MNEETVEKYECLRDRRGKGDSQKAHQLRRSAFSAYQFHIIGSKPVLHAFIKFPICSAAKPAKFIQKFLDFRAGVEDQEKAGKDKGKGRPPSGSDGRWERSRSRTRHE